jgi:hypothetical protein
LASQPASPIRPGGADGGFPAPGTFLRVPAATAATISPRLGSLPEIRTVLQIVGPSNMIMAVSL